MRASFTRWTFPLGCGIALQAMAAMAQSTDGFFTPNQATAGSDIYQKQCASCHGGDMEGYIGPALSGHAFQVIASRQENVYRLFTIIAADEPQNNPGSLTGEQYADVVAFILQRNGYPAGKNELLAFSPHLRDLALAR